MFSKSEEIPGWDALCNSKDQTFGVQKVVTDSIEINNGIGYYLTHKPQIILAGPLRNIKLPFLMYHHGLQQNCLCGKADGWKPLFKSAEKSFVSFPTRSEVIR